MQELQFTLCYVSVCWFGIYCCSWYDYFNHCYVADMLVRVHLWLLT